jgi:bifunctional DNA primase/polymerase-like protein/uncharacterized protein DUF3987
VYTHNSTDNPNYASRIAAGLAALDYLKAGFSPIPLQPASKKPVDTGWVEAPHLTEAEIAEKFTLDSNVGIRLGKIGNRRIDVDCETTAAARLWRYFLPATPVVHGRASLPDSHPWYAVVGPDPDFLTLSDCDGTKLLELRWTAGAQAAVPPSVHPSGELYTGDLLTGQPTTVDGKELSRGVRTLAAATLLVRHYAKKDHRHDFALSLSGFLLNNSWSEADAKNFVGAVAQVAGDEESAARIVNVETTAQKVRNGEKVKGGVEFRKIVGDEVMDRFCEMLVITKSNRATTTTNRTDLPIIDVPDVPAEVIPPWPAATLDGDYVGDLVNVMAMGNPLPGQFLRESILQCLAALLDRPRGSLALVAFPAHFSLVLRRYLVMLSAWPQMGKNESWRRVRDLFKFYLDTAMPKTEIRSGTSIGSAEYLAVILETQPNLLLVWDEAQSLLAKASQRQSGLLPGFTTLYESNEWYTGSRTNKPAGQENAQLSILLQSTLDAFLKGFSTSGGVGSGLLSRFTLAYANEWKTVPIWPDQDHARERTLAQKIIDQIPAAPTALTMASDAQDCLSAFILELGQFPRQEFIPRLADHVRRDLLMRAVFAGATLITLPMVERSIVWGRHQLALRLAFWPPDADNDIGVMEKKIIRRAEKGRAARRDFLIATHAYRDGKVEMLNRALASLLKADILKIVAKTPKGLDVYELNECYHQSKGENL